MWESSFGYTESGKLKEKEYIAFDYSDEKYGYYVGDEIFDTFEEAYDYYKSFDD